MTPTYTEGDFIPEDKVLGNKNISFDGNGTPSVSEPKTYTEERVRELMDKFCVMFERAGREHGESGDEWAEKAEAFLIGSIAGAKAEERNETVGAVRKLMKDNDKYLKVTPTEEGRQRVSDWISGYNQMGADLIDKLGMTDRVADEITRTPEQTDTLTTEV